MVQEYLYEKNYSLWDVLDHLDDQKEGYVKVKKIKDYFLKVTQDAYLIH
jgi:hypothetical protein